jgi:hypothetical protein
VDRLVQRFQQAEAKLGLGPQVGTVPPGVAVRAGPIIVGAAGAAEGSGRN